MGVPLYVMCHFSLVSFNILSVLNFCQFDYCVSRCVPPWAHPSWETLCFLDLTISFPMFGKFSAFICSNIFSGPFLPSSSGTPIMRMFVCFILSQRSLRLSSFLFILFPVFCSLAVISTILSSRSFICVFASAMFLLWFLSLFLCSLVLLGLW